MTEFDNHMTWQLCLFLSLMQVSSRCRSTVSDVPICLSSSLHPRSIHPAKNHHTIRELSKSGNALEHKTLPHTAARQQPMTLLAPNVEQSAENPDMCMREQAAAAKTAPATADLPPTCMACSPH